MKVSDLFLSRLRKAIEEIPDTDGEPGYFASVSAETEDGPNDALILHISTGPDDLQEHEEDYELTIRRLK